MDNLQELIFENYRIQIIESLNEMIKNESIKLPKDENYTIIDGFMFNYALPSFVIGTIPLGGGVAIPMIALVGEKSGQVYQFALKKVLPDLFNLMQDADK